MTCLQWAGETLTLLPEKAIFLPASATLLVADAHIGKAVSFRALGVPVPRGTTSDTLDRLTLLLSRWQPQRVVFLGDFLHSARAHATFTLAALAAWRERHARLDLVLVRGNHDDQAGDPPARLGFHVVDEPYALDGFALRHHPVALADVPVLSGHLHPCITLRGPGSDRLRLPCFHFSDRLGVLPAFGGFTGMHPVSAKPADRIFVVADGQVVELPSSDSDARPTALKAARPAPA